MPEFKGYTTVLDKQIYFEFVNEEIIDTSETIIVFLHEGLGSCGQWKDFPALLCNKTNLPGIMYDRYGYGKSSKLAENRSVDFMHEEALKFLPILLENLKLSSKKLVLVGHSDGGSIALIHAASNKKQVIGIITEAAHVFVEDATLQGIKEAVADYEVVTRNPLLKYHRENTDSLFYKWTEIWLSNDFKNWNILEYITQINAPLLAIQGAEDNYGTEEQLRKISCANATAEIELIPNCGHIPHFQAKDLILKIMSDFINKIID